MIPLKLLLMTITNSMVVTDKKLRTLLTIGFGVYLLILLYFLLFAEGFGRTSVRQEYQYNLTLFQEIRRYWVNWEKIGWKLAFVNLFGNVIVFIPLGFLAPCILVQRPRCWKIVLGSFLLSLTIELTQLICKIGCCDIDDVFLNTVGGLVGYMIYKITVWIISCIQKGRHNERIS